MREFIVAEFISLDGVIHAPVFGGNAPQLHIGGGITSSHGRRYDSPSTQCVLSCAD